VEKGDLLEDSCSWVLNDPAFREWWDDDKTRILWIHGDPGKGKTMMAIALIKQITTLLKSDPHHSGTLAYFFCQSTVDRLNNAVAVVRSLIYLLVDRQRTFMQHVQKRFEVAGSHLFEGDNALYALWNILLDLLEDPALPRVYLLVDALDECTLQQVELLKLITNRNMASLSKVKWLVTSRNEPAIKELLEQGDRRVHTSLELNSHHISHDVTKFIKSKVAELVQRKGYDDQLRRFIHTYLQDQANGTFLWVALVCQELLKVPPRKARSALKRFPAGLEPLYMRMMEQISSLADTEDVELCSSILRAVTMAVRPLHLNELVFVAKLPDRMHKDLPLVCELVSLCGSFLTLREETVSFVHQSAKDFLSVGRGVSIFSSGQSRDHSIVARRCRELMSRTLRKDICDLRVPGVVIDEVEPERVVRCLSTPVQYACCYWVNHLLHSWCDAGLASPRDREEVQTFFRRAFLHWIEALSLIGKISEGVTMVMELESAIQVSSRPYRIHYGKNREMLMSSVSSLNMIHG
jgi:NACHT domain